MPDIEAIYNAYTRYRNAATGLLYQYAGKNAELCSLLDGDVPDWSAVSMDAYFVHKIYDEFKGVLNKANSILPESKIKRTLTESDKRLIDTLVSPNALPFMAEITVKDIAANSPELAELFALDERYAKYLETEAEE